MSEVHSFTHSTGRYIKSGWTEILQAEVTIYNNVNTRVYDRLTTDWDSRTRGDLRIHGKWVIELIKSGCKRHQVKYHTYYTEL